MTTTYDDRGNSRIAVTNNAIHTSSFPAGGTYSSYSMNASTNIVPANAQELWTDATGAKDVYLDFKEIASGKYVIVAWSTTASAGTTVENYIDLKAASRAANAGAGNGSLQNAIVVFSTTPMPVRLCWDNTNTIKTIGCQGVDAAVTYELLAVF